MRRWRKRREAEAVCLLGCAALRCRSWSCERGKGEEEGRPDRHYVNRGGAPGELLCVQVALWLVVVVCRPAGRMETVKEAGVERGCALGCCPRMCVFCAGSCASAVAPEPRPRRRGTVRWRRRPTCAVCMAEEVEELMSPLLVACWKTRAASWSWEGSGLCWASVGGASLCCERRMRKTISDWGSAERFHGRLG